MSDGGSHLIDLIADAPVDVQRTVRSLVDEGWAPTAGSGPPGTPNGNVLLDLRRGPDRIRIVCDRSQWMLGFHLAGWASEVSLSTVADVLASRRDWVPWRSGAALPAQVPPDVPWSEAVPRALAWAASTPDAEAVARELEERRAGLLFPPNGA